MALQLKRISKTTCVIEQDSAMHVPGRVYLSEVLEAQIDDNCLEQVRNVAMLPGIVGASIAMPDMHIGYGFPIGGVAAFSEANGQGLISPGGIGFDINCGVRMLTTNLTKEDVEPFMEALLELLSKSVPVGSGRESSIRLSHAELDEVLQEGGGWARRKNYATDDDIEKTEEHGCLAGADPAAVSSFAKDRGVNQLGTLGAGNHFLEIQVVDKILHEQKASAFGITKPGQIVVMIHCGSRGLGHQVCTDYVRKMEDAFPDIAKSLPEKNLMYAPLTSELGKKYFAAMACAANFAWCNRQLITHHVRASFRRLFPQSEVRVLYDVSHNIAKHETHEVDGTHVQLCVHRKGATRAFGPGHADVCSAYRAYGQPVLIPGSMGTASYVLVGTTHAMTETFGSTCHGAGRKMSRTKALETIRGEQVRRDLHEKGIQVIAPGKGLAEEAPAAYKDVDEVIAVVAEAGIAVPVARVTPIGVLKG